MVMIWVQLNDTEKLVLPNFSQLIKMEEEKKEGKVVLNLKDLSEKLETYKSDIEKIEIYRNNASIIIKDKPESVKIYDL